MLPALKKQKSSVLKDSVGHIDLTKTKTIADLVESFQDASIQARNVGLCARVFERMLTDPDRPTILLGLAGPLIAAGLRKVIRDLIEYNELKEGKATGL